ncbi:hypothetical protein ACTTAF_08725 [Rhodobacter capsulatus]|uniref:hypothetical protein n=1 Tax=Rhodobacter capsulatus TaxID=1061 RepID=UPI0040387E75
MSAGSETALIAGGGALPGLLLQAAPEMLVCALEGQPAPGGSVLPFRIERLVPFLDALADRGIRRVCFAGAMQRPKLEPELFDARTAALVPRLLGAMQAGDDATLRAVIALFEDWDFEVIGADEIAPALVPGDGLFVRQRRRSGPARCGPRGGNRRGFGRGRCRAGGGGRPRALPWGRGASGHRCAP